MTDASHNRLTVFEDLCVGQRACLKKTVTDTDLSHFIAITGDENPLHVNDAFAQKTFFGRRIAHGMLSAALFSTLVGMHLPGTGAIYRSQTLEFLQPVFIGDRLCAWFEITGIDKKSETIEIKSWIENQRNEVVIKGKAVAGLLRGFVESGEDCGQKNG